MAYFDIKESKPLTSSVASFTNPKITLLNGDHLEKIPQSLFGSLYSYRIAYPSDNRTKLTYYDSGTPTLYKPEYIYIYGLLHNNITGLTTENDDPKKDIVGEMVIQYSSDATSNKLFLCVLLKKSSSPTTAITSIEKIINMSETEKTDTENYTRSVDLNFDLDIPVEQKFFKYIDTKSFVNNTVIVLLNPTMISSNEVSIIISKLTPDTRLFSIGAPPDYVNITSTASKQDNKGKNTRNKLSKDEIYIDCNPTNDDLKDATTYNLPIGSALSKDIQKMDFMKTSVNFFVFMIGIAFIYGVVPITYKTLVIDNIIEAYDDDKEKKIRIRSVDVLFILGFLILMITFFHYGFKKKGDPKMATYGVFTFVFLILSYVIIQFYKASDSWITYIKDEEKEKMFYDFPDIGRLLVSIISYAYLFNNFKDGLNGGATMPVLVILIIFIIGLAIALYISENLDKYGEYFSQYFGLIMIGIPFMMFLMGIGK